MVENMTTQVDKHLNDITSKMNQINNSLSDYEVKNKVSWMNVHVE